MTLVTHLFSYCCVTTYLHNTAKKTAIGARFQFSTTIPSMTHFHTKLHYNEDWIKLKYIRLTTLF